MTMTRNRFAKGMIRGLENRIDIQAPAAAPMNAPPEYRSKSVMAACTRYACRFPMAHASESSRHTAPKTKETRTTNAVLPSTTALREKPQVRRISMEPLIRSAANTELAKPLLTITESDSHQSPERNPGPPAALYRGRKLHTNTRTAYTTNTPFSLPVKQAHSFPTIVPACFTAVLSSRPAAERAHFFLDGLLVGPHLGNVAPCGGKTGNDFRHHSRRVGSRKTPATVAILCRSTAPGFDDCFVLFIACASDKP